MLRNLIFLELSGKRQNKNDDENYIIVQSAGGVADQCFAAQCRTLPVNKLTSSALITNNTSLIF